MTREQKAYQAETEEKLKAQREIERLKSEPEPKESALSPETEYELGKRFHDEWDYRRAIEHYIIAAEHGHVKAQTTLGTMYYYGNGVSQDKSESLKWFRRAAEQGDSEARFMLKYLHQ